MNKKNLKIFELFDGEYPFYAGQTLLIFESDISHVKKNYSSRIANMKEASKGIKEVKKYFDDNTITPYLILSGFKNEKEEKGIFEKLQNLVPMLWENDFRINGKTIEDSVYQKKQFQNFVREIENPSEDTKFMKHLLNKIAFDPKSRKFYEAEKAENLFVKYANEKSIPLLMNKLRETSRLYMKLESCLDSFEK